MSKNLFATLAFLIVFFTFTAIARAQDYEGIDPGPGTTPPATTQPPATTPAPTQTRTQILDDLKTQEQINFQVVKDRYSSTLITKSTNTTDGTAAADYKLSSTLVSARYHKTLELYINYLQKIDQSFSASGFQIDGSEEALNQEQQKLTALANSITGFDTTIDNFPATSDADLPNFSSQINTMSENIKAQIEGGKNDLLDLVGMVQ